VTIEKIETPQQMALVEALAEEIWKEHYTPIIGRDQVAYMLKTFQSREAVAEQIEAGYLYYLMHRKGEPVGYMAVRPEEERLFLSKLYVRGPHRGRGCAREALAFLSEMAAGMGLRTIALTVNKNNTGSVRAYGRLGFVKTGEVVQAIGGGFAMDDYMMEMDLAGPEDETAR